MIAIRHYPAQKELTAEAIESAQSSVHALNDALAERFPDAEGMKIIAWMSDIHIHTDDGYDEDISIYEHDVDTRRQLALALHEVHALRPEPELLVLGGDLTDYGRVAEFRALQAVLDKLNWTIPSIPLFGNHDNALSPIHPKVLDLWPSIRQPGWPAISDPHELYYSVKKAGFKFIVLDTQQSNGYVMPARQKEWLQAELEEADLPVIVLCHRHQLPVGNWVDEASMFRDPAVWRMIDGAPHVAGIFSGHVHLARLWQFRRKLYGTFPAVAYGIGDRTGWGGLVLKDNRIAAVFRKDLHGEGCDLMAGMEMQEGAFRFMEAELFQNHILCNPCYWPWEPEISLRD